MTLIYFHWRTERIVSLYKHHQSRVLVFCCKRHLWMWKQLFFFFFLFLLTFTPGSKASAMIIRDCIYFFHLKFFLLSSVSPYESMGNLCGIEKRGIDFFHAWHKSQTLDTNTHMYIHTWKCTHTEIDDRDRQIDR